MAILRPAPEPRVETIEGRRTLIVERRPPLPASLQLLLDGGRDNLGRLWGALRVTTRLSLATGGTARSCLDQDHRLQRWIEGFHAGSDGTTRLLRLLCCRDCAAVCVRDISIDEEPGLPAGRRQLRRRDHVMGWYSGARRNQRVYSLPRPTRRA